MGVEWKVSLAFTWAIDQRRVSHWNVHARARAFRNQRLEGLLSMSILGRRLRVNRHKHQAFFACDWALEQYDIQYWYEHA